ncbi:hypothetical protein HK098_003849 [Nowakowskiella sp. JEL0407]|nr:hypothetical protein HK098_003849 [Nowakowskiella sp. JEL0407]
MCPWHGACFSVKTGDIEDAPSVDGLLSFKVVTKGDKLFIEVTESELKAGRKKPLVCKRVPEEKEEVVVILGGGAAGMIAAETLRQVSKLSSTIFFFLTDCYFTQKNFTGRIVLITREPHLPIDRPKLSKSLKIDASKILLRDQAHFTELNIEFHVSTEASMVDAATKKVTLSNGTVLDFTYLIIATGADPRKLSIPNANLSNIHVLRTVSDANEIESSLSSLSGTKPRVAIVGSSFVGMETAAVLAKTSAVTVIGMEKTPFERVLGPQVGSAFQKLFESNGVVLKMNAVVEKYVPSGSNPNAVGGVVLKSGEQIDADVVVIGAGVIPKTDYLGGSGVLLDRDGGITVQSSLNLKEFPYVYVAGDIARFPYHLTGSLVRIEHWNVAENQGRLIASNIASKSLEPFKSIPYFWTMFFGKSVRYAGHANTFDEVIIQGSLDLDTLGFVAFYCLEGKVLAVASLAKDPVVSHASELLRLGKFPSASEVRDGKNILDVKL